MLNWCVTCRSFLEACQPILFFLLNPSSLGPPLLRSASCFVSYTIFVISQIHGTYCLLWAQVRMNLSFWAMSHWVPKGKKKTYVSCGFVLCFTYKTLPLFYLISMCNSLKISCAPHLKKTCYSKSQAMTFHRGITVCLKKTLYYIENLILFKW